ncbi:hypothetical protein M0R88_01125 [Halorussus gelatinilyticus]|uniref:Hsp20/alpha crystallin family protein n=1 Tax=Halorussus gelatinilyticus TaxID=2937524 RepID=A0A8U0IKZ5_9EURY|nr:hypothetical protein [Halorussus gelatinilyticus]UPW00719.1 hypothetical protein M0R88_01125 [Halorussus gelatinilyticus]
MTLKHITERDDVFARSYEYEDGEVLAADLGVAGNASVDVLDDTAIVVFEGEDGPEQVEFQLPEEGAEAFITNGVLTIEVGL